MLLEVPTGQIKFLRESVADARNRLARNAETDTTPWAAWSSYPVGRILQNNDTAEFSLARALDDWHGATIVCDYQTFLSIARSDIIPQFNNLTTIMTSIDRSVFVALPYLAPATQNLTGLLLNLNDVEEERNVGITTIPFYQGKTLDKRLLFWANTPVKDMFNPSTMIYREDIDGIARIGLALWAMAGFQTSRGALPLHHQNGLVIHSVQPFTKLINSN